MKKKRERGNIEKKRRRNIPVVNLEGKEKQGQENNSKNKKRKRRTVVKKKAIKGTLVSHTFVFVYLWIFNISVTDEQVVSFMQH